MLALVAFLAVASPTKVLVLDVAGESLTKDEAGAIRERLTAEVAKRKDVSVITAEDMRRVLDVEAQRQATGCAGESACLAEIGAALGADRVLYASVHKLGEQYVVSLSLVDPSSARSAGRDSYQADSLSHAADELPNAAARLFGGASLSTSLSSSAAPGRGAPVITITGGVIAGAGIVAGIGFGVATFVAQDTLQNPKKSGAEKAAALAQGPLYLNATLVSGGVLALGGLVTLIGLIAE